MKTLRVATAHFQSDRWIAPQARYLERFSILPVKTYAHLEGVDAAASREVFHRVSTQECADGRHSPHGLKLNHLLDLILDDPATDPDDYVLFLDSDALPIRPLDPEAVLDGFPVAAVRRDESDPCRLVHPCFALARVRTWARLPADWRSREGDFPENDVGSRIRDRLQEASTEWRPLLRSNERNLHPVLYGVYADLAYHHGHGSRAHAVPGSPAHRLGQAQKRRMRPLSRKPARRGAQRTYRAARYRALRAARLRILQRQQSQSDRVYDWLLNDDDFLSRFCPSRSDESPSTGVGEHSAGHA